MDDRCAQPTRGPRARRQYSAPMDEAAAQNTSPREPAEASAHPQPQIDSGRRAASYRFVEGLHLRQWLARATAPLAIACTNGAGWLDTNALPSHDAPLSWWSFPASAEVGARIVGGALILVAAWLRIESKGVLVRRVTLTTGGVYAWVRHPFYLAVMLGSVGLLMLSGALGTVLAAVWLALAAPVYAATVAGEEDGLGTLFPDAWDAYARDVPRLVPLPGRRATNVGTKPTRVTWENLIAEHEPPRLLRFFGATAAVGGCALGGDPGLALFAAAVALFAASRLAPGIRPPSRRRARP